jgi:hypothetical protein
MPHAIPASVCTVTNVTCEVKSSVNAQRLYYSLPAAAAAATALEVIGAPVVLSLLENCGDVADIGLFQRYLMQ